MRVLRGRRRCALGLRRRPQVRTRAVPAAVRAVARARRAAAAVRTPSLYADSFCIHKYIHFICQRKSKNKADHDTLLTNLKLLFM